MPTPTIVVQSDTTGTTISTLPPTGQATGANSLPVVLATDQGPVTVTPAQASSIATGQVSVGATAGGTLIVAARTGRRSVVIVQEGTTLVRLGASGVTTTTGVPLPGTAYAAFTIDGGAAVYGITASGSATVSFVEIF